MIFDFLRLSFTLASVDITGAGVTVVPVFTVVVVDSVVVVAGAGVSTTTGVVAGAGVVVVCLVVVVLVWALAEYAPVANKADKMRAFFIVNQWSVGMNKKLGCSKASCFCLALNAVRLPRLGFC